MASTISRPSKYKAVPRTLSVLLSSFPLCLPVFASENATMLQEVRVVAQNENDLQGKRTAVTLDSKGLPAGVTVVTREDMETVNVGRDISAIYRRIPGVVANNVDQGDTGNGFRMRGFATQGTHGADTAVYVDGVPQNIPSSQAGAGHGPSFLEWLTPDMIGRVDVIKGPISALYGDQNRAGAVNITTARGGDIPSSAGISLENYNGKRATVVLSKRFENVDSLLVADSYRANGYRHASRIERDNFFWKLSTNYGDASYSLRLSHATTDFQAAGFLLLKDLKAGLDPRSTQLNNPGFGSGDRTTLVFNRAPLQGESGLYASAYVEQFERSRAIASSATEHNIGSDDRNIGGGRLYQNVTFGDTAALTFGGDIRRDRGDAMRQRYANRQPTGNYVNNYNLDLLTYGLFVQGQYRPTTSIKLLGGLRYDWFDYDIENRKLPGASTDYKNSVMTPKLGIVWSASKQLDLFANAAEGFRSPYAEQLSPGGALGPLGTPGGITNTNIGPSKVLSYDVGFTTTPLKGWTASGVMYHTANQDEIVMTAPDVYTSVGETIRRGFELETRLAVTDNLSVYANYARIVEARIENPLPNTGDRLVVPKNQYKAGIEHRQYVIGGKLTMTADAYILADMPYYMGVPQTQLETMPTYVRYDLKAVYDTGRYQLAAFVVSQPHEYASDSSYATAGGLMVATMPKLLFGGSFRYYF